MAVTPGEEVLFVSNGNSELRYDSGSVLVLDLGAVETIARDWADTGEVPGDRDCNRDLDFFYLLECNESEVVVPDGGVRVGNFSTDMAVQELSSGALRLFVAVRGDPSVTYIDYNAGARNLECGGNGDFPRCDEAHRLTALRDDEELPTLADEPFGIFVDSINGYAMVTHLTSATVTLVNAPPGGEAPVIADVLTGLFASDPNTGQRGAAGVAGRLPGSEDDLLYVTSRTEARVQMVYVHRSPSLGLPIIVPSEFFFMRNILPSDNGRGIAFSATGERAYVVNRDPPMLQILDTSLDTTGFPVNELLDGIEICRDGSNVRVADSGDGDRVYITCFSSGQVWVINPAESDVEAVIDVGRGPNGMAIAPGRQLAFVGNFLDDSVAVIDTRPGSPTENRVVLRLGRTRAAGGN